MACTCLDTPLLCAAETVPPRDAISTAAAWPPHISQSKVMHQQRAPDAAEGRISAGWQGTPRGSWAAEAALETAGCGNDAAVHPAPCVVSAPCVVPEPAMPARLPSTIKARLLSSAPSANSNMESSAAAASQHDHPPAHSQPAIARSGSAHMATTSAQEVSEDCSELSPALLGASSQPQAAANGLVTPKACALVQPIWSQVTSPDLRAAQDIDDMGGRSAAELVRRSSMAVQPSTTLDLWPAADAEAELVLDELGELADWTPVQRHQNRALRPAGCGPSPVSTRRGVAGSQRLSASLDAGAAMYSRAIVARLRKEAR